jgi:hypothetical protein
MAKPPFPSEGLELAAVRGLLKEISASASENRSRLELSETYSRGTGCLNWARPGLWGLRGGNSPVLPGPFYRTPRTGNGD